MSTRSSYHMRAPFKTTHGFTLLELLIVLVIVGTLASLVAPTFDRAISSLRARSALDRLVSEVYSVRMLAVERGAPVRLVLRRAPDGCTRSLHTIVAGPGSDEPLSNTVPLDSRGFCLTHTGDSVLVFNSRGMLRPPARSFIVQHGSSADTALISIAGRIRRSY